MKLPQTISRMVRLLSLENRIALLEEERRELRDQLDLLKSSLEVPRDWIDEFRAWKRDNPVPAEPLITVCVATHNRAKLLMERSVPSILAQTYGNFELIVVGDGCTDRTAEAMSGVADPRVRYIDLPERGAYPEDPTRRWMVAGTQATNAAMAEARGDFVTHLDDDDEFLPDRLEKLTAFALERSADFVWHPFWWEDDAGEWHLNEARDFAFRQVTTSAVFYRRWFTRVTWNVEAHLLMEPGDWNRFRRIRYIGPSAARYPEPLLRHYRERNQSAPAV